MKTVIETADRDTTRAKALLKLAEKLCYSNPDTAIVLSKQALRIYKAREIEKGIASAYNHIGVFYKMKSDYPAALEYYQKGHKESSEHHPTRQGNPDLEKDPDLKEDPNMDYRNDDWDAGYTGINAAFVMDRLAVLETNDNEAEALRSRAHDLRKSLLE